MLITKDWTKSSESNADCVLARVNGDRVELSDSKEPDRPVLASYTHAEWRAFVAGAKAGEFDLPD